MLHFVSLSIGFIGLGFLLTGHWLIALVLGLLGLLFIWLVS